MMSMIKDTVYDIQEAIIAGDLAYSTIAVIYGVTERDVELIAEELNEMLEGDRDMDIRDYDGEALASAGWGTDEDYVCDNDYFDDY
jgi:hypothetical protein